MRTGGRKGGEARNRHDTHAHLHTLHCCKVWTHMFRFKSSLPEPNSQEEYHYGLRCASWVIVVITWLLQFLSVLIKCYIKRILLVSKMHTFNFSPAFYVSIENVIIVDFTVSTFHHVNIDSNKCLCWICCVCLVILRFNVLFHVSKQWKNPAVYPPNISICLWGFHSPWYVWGNKERAVLDIYSHSG